MGKVVPHTAATFHQLHLFLIYTQDGTIRVGITIQTDHEAVGQ